MRTAQIRMPVTPPLIYMDNHATTRVDPRVVAAMLPFLSEEYGLPEGPRYALNQRAWQIVEESRAAVARGLGASSDELFFTSGATESNNWALQAITACVAHSGRHLVSMATEHASVLAPLHRLARHGWEITLLAPRNHTQDDAGRIDLESLEAALRPDTVLVSVMFANNEIGVVQPLRAIGDVCHARGILLHCDATQAVGKIPIALRDEPIDLMSFTAHKFYGPKGIGALYVRGTSPARHAMSRFREQSGYPLARDPSNHVAGIVGLSSALELSLEEGADESRRIQTLRDRLYAGLRSAVSGVALNGPKLDLVGSRLPGNLNVRFDGVDGEALMLAVPELAVSSGSACRSRRVDSSHVLRALGLTDAEARTTLRFGLGRYTTAAEVECLVHRLAAAVTTLRVLAPQSSG